jgi:ADP-L-glycero-D-manno-heptose 6-epimerase
MTRIVVTGAAGFIGSNIIQGLNARGMDDIIAVDDLTQGDKFRNLADLKILDYLDADSFYEAFAQGSFGQIEAVFHQGACTDPLERNGKVMMNNNYATSVSLYQACQKRGARLLYASSAATYGDAKLCREDPALERPLSLYGYSKHLFDQRMRRECGLDFRRALSGKTGQVVGLRYFDVYGPREQHKGRGASLAFQCFKEFKAEGKIQLTAYGDATTAPLYDMVSVDDVVAVNLWFFDHPGQSGIFNVGTGQAHSHPQIASVVINALRSLQGQEALSPPVLEASGMIEFAPVPEGQHGKLPTLAQADLNALRGAGCQQMLTDMPAGVARYVQWLASQDKQKFLTG